MNFFIYGFLEVIAITYLYIHDFIIGKSLIVNLVFQEM